MYAMIRRYSGRGSVAEEVVRRVTQGLVPTLRQSPGFVGYCAFGSEDGDIYSVSLFDTRQTAEAAHTRVREWVQANLQDLLPNPPEVTAGEVGNNEMTQMQGGGAGQPFVTLRFFDSLRGGMSNITRRVSEELIPVMKRQSGFRGYCNFLTDPDQDASRGASVSFWQNREAAMAGTEQVLATATAKLSDMMPNPPKRVAGQSLVMAMTPSPQPSPSA